MGLSPRPKLITPNILPLYCVCLSTRKGSKIANINYSKLNAFAKPNKIDPSIHYISYVIQPCSSATNNLHNPEPLSIKAV